MVVFDVGETLVDESRGWLSQARAAGISAFTFSAMFGSLIERSMDHRLIWKELGIQAPDHVGQILSSDLYHDARSTLRALQGIGLSVGIAGNQPEGAIKQLAETGISADFVASSTQWGIAKPDEKFFARVMEESGLAADAILYVGDRLDNDVLPARKSGMKTAFIIRGPWGHIHARRPEANLADYRIQSLEELVHLLA